MSRLFGDTLCRACSLELRGDDTGDLRGLVFEGADDIDFTAQVSCRACGPTMVNSEGLCMFGQCLKLGQPGHGGYALVTPKVIAGGFPTEEDDDEDIDDEEEEDDEIADEDFEDEDEDDEDE